MGLVLAIEDDKILWSLLTKMLAKMGHESLFAATLAEGLALAAAQRPDVVLLDLRLPDGNGLDFLPKLKKTAGRPEVIIITGMADRTGAELAFKSGAWDFLAKPFNRDEVALSLSRAMQFRESRLAVAKPVVLKRPHIVGDSPAIMSCLDQVAAAAAGNANVLISGPTGTGKEVFARAIHENSSRAQGNFVIVDCTVLPENLVESILFGHKKGAFTGAAEDRPGLIKQADKGTLFLDEVGELPLAAQSSFLRVLQERRFRPVGGSAEVESDFRLLSATNRDLSALAAKGEFRQDLLFRLKTLNIELPPLNERGRDLQALVFYHLNRLCEVYGLEPKGMAPEVFRVLSSYHWPGNVRELISVLEETLAAAGDHPTLYPFHLPTRLRLNQVDWSGGEGAAGGETAESMALTNFQDFRQQTMDQAEKSYLQALLKMAGDDRQKAMDVSGLSQSRLYALIKKHGLAAFKYRN